jgi:ABC-type uncharacterized transport system involved in gliding motility auxiliary subunit
MMMMQRQQPTPPWVFLRELKENYEVKDIPLTVDKIEDGISVLLIVHPKGITDKAQFAIDQFILRGGKVVALLDPFSFVEAQMSGQNGQGGAFNSTLDKLLPKWGIDFSSGKVLADPIFATQIQQQETIVADPTILSITEDGINKQDVLGAAISDLLMPFAGVFTGTPVEGLKEDVLIKSTKRAGLIDTAIVQEGADAVRKTLKSGNTEYPIAIRLSGKFKTAFPNGNPSTSETKPGEKSGSLPSPTPEGAKAAEPLLTPPTQDTMKEATAVSVVVLVGDSDFAYDAIAGRTQQILNQTTFAPSNGNLNLIQSSIEQLAGDSNLIGIRSRATGNRPFEVVNKMQASAQEKYQGKIDALQGSLDETRQKLAALQAKKQSDQKTLLSPEEQAEIKKFHENEAQVSQELKQVRKDLRQEIDSLQDSLKWLNIAGMPILITIAGLALAWIKRKRRAAR